MCLTFNFIFITYQEAIRNVARYRSKNTIELKAVLKVSESVKLATVKTVKELGKTSA